jgi:hypothetical protein
VDARRRKGHRECVCIVLVTMVRYLCGERPLSVVRLSLWRSGVSTSAGLWCVVSCARYVRSRGLSLQLTVYRSQFIASQDSCLWSVDTRPRAHVAFGVASVICPAARHRKQFLACLRCARSWAHRKCILPESVCLILWSCAAKGGSVLGKRRVRARQHNGASLVPTIGACAPAARPALTHSQRRA